MRFSLISIFPELFGPLFETSLLGKAVAAGRVTPRYFDPRAYAADRHRVVDDTPYGGGPGMVMKPEPLVAAIEAAEREGEACGAGRPRRILLSAAGAPLTHDKVVELAGLSHVALVCGRYEGVDERAIDEAIDEELSIGDFVMTGGEVAAMAAVDAIARFVPGVLGEASSTAEESFSEPLLEYPHYTRPAVFRGREVPAVLRSGDHAAIRRWRRARALERTEARRPDLLADAGSAGALTAEDRALLHEVSPRAELAARSYVLLAHYPVYDRSREVVTTAVNNLDIHDIARSAASFGLAGYVVTTPISAQKEKIEQILGAWEGQAEREGEPEDHRIRALERVWVAESADAALARIAERHGRPPHVVATSAEPPAAGELPPIGTATLARERMAAPEPMVLLFGTGFGLAVEAMARADSRLAPISGVPAFNHLSVRSAVAMILDRLFGLR